MGKLEPGHSQTDTLLSLGQERLAWSDLRRRVARTAGLDAQLNVRYEDSNSRMNNLLETYHHLLLGGVVLEPVKLDIPIRHTDEAYSPQVESD